MDEIFRIADGSPCCATRGGRDEEPLDEIDIDTVIS
jgi:hypothetical protein